MKRVVILLVSAVATAGIGCHRQEAKPATTGSDVGAKPAPAPPPVAKSDPWQKPDAAKDPLPHPLFWSVEKDGKTTYFLGTMHLGVDASSRLPDLVWQKLDGAKAFAMETDLDAAGGLDGMRRKDGSLHKDLGDDYWKKLLDALGPGAGPQMDHMKPMVPAATLSMRGLPITLPMDMVLSARAKNENKPIVFLEPADRQIAILDKWMDVKALKMMLDELPEGEQHSKEMLAAYIEGDEKKIVAISDSEKDDAIKHGYTAAEYDQEMNEMLYNRNASWIDALEKLHADGGGFVAVGAMHLLGKRSVLDLLARKGYKVTRITP